MRLLVVGTLAFDSVETPHGVRDNTLGGSASFSAIAAAYFCPVRMVGVVGDDFPEEHLEFYQTRAIDIAGVERSPGKTFRWSGVYSHDFNARETRETQLNVLETFDPVVPPAYLDSEFVVLGNFDPTLQRKVLEQLKKPQLVAADTMDFWINGANAELKKTLARVDLLSINDEEARLLSGEHSLVKAAEYIRRLGPKMVVIKRGEHGATVFSEDGIFMAPAYPLLSVKDPTGAGDCFAGGLMGFLAQHNTVSPQILRRAVIMGSTLASFAVEDFSLDRFRNLHAEEIKDRFKAFRDLTHFETGDPFASR
ncbi:MAG: PfkB family carbohydrate kinase [Myxococcota bacterium]